MSKRTKGQKIALGVMTATMAVSPLATFAQQNDNGGQSNAHSKAKHAVPLAPMNGDLVAPNQEVQFQVNQEDREFNSVRQQLENQSFGIVLVSETGEQVFLSAEDGSVSYNEDGTITISNHADFDRYTSYSASVLVKSDYEQALKGKLPTEFASATSGVSFQTGSAVGEATNIDATVEDDTVKVTDVGVLSVEVTDDYGNPATDATLKVSGVGTGNAKVASTFPTEQVLSITDGTAEVELSDHSANDVALSYEVVDNIYEDGDGESEAGTTTVTFLPGDVSQVDLETPSKIQAGKNYTITGEAEDVYGNNVSDGTDLDVTAETGTVSNETATVSGKFGFAYKAPTKIGKAGLKIANSEVAYSFNEDLVVVASDPSKLTINMPSDLKSGQSVAVSGTLSDEYGNPVANEPVTLSGGLNGTLMTNETGQYSGNVTTGTSSGSTTVTAKVSGATVPLTTPTGSPVSTVTIGTNGINPATDLYRKTSSGIQYSTDNGSTWKSVYIASNLVGVVYDSYNKTWVALADYSYMGNYGRYYFGYIYTSTDGVNWKYSTNIQVNFNAIAVDDKGHVVIGGGYSSSYGVTTYIYTSSNGGKSFSKTLDSYKSNTGGYGSGKGTINAITWDGNQFKAQGQFKYSTYWAYSSNGLSWR